MEAPTTKVSVVGRTRRSDSRYLIGIEIQTGGAIYEWNLAEPSFIDEADANETADKLADYVAEQIRNTHSIPPQFKRVLRQDDTLTIF